jgi:hypothetical protein
MKTFRANQPAKQRQELPMKTVVTSMLLLIGLMAGAAHAAPPAPKAEKDTAPVRVVTPLPKKVAGQKPPKAHGEWIEVYSVGWAKEPKTKAVRARE